MGVHITEYCTILKSISCWNIIALALPKTALKYKNSIFLRKNLDGKEVRYDERVFGRDENDQGSGVASEGFF